MKFHGLLFFNAISWILSLKKTLLTLLTNLLKLLQSDLDLEIQYIERFLLHFSFYHALECLVILIYFECLSQSSSVIDMNYYVILFNVSQSEILAVLIHPTLFLL